MARSPREPNLTGQLRMMLQMAGSRPVPWVSSTVGLSILLALLDTLGVAAMVPLTQLLTGTVPDSGALGAIARFLRHDRPGVPHSCRRGNRHRAVRREEQRGPGVPLVAPRPHHPGLRTRRRAELMRRYVLAPYADHRARRLSEVYRNITDATAQSSSVLLGVMSLISDTLSSSRSRPSSPSPHPW